MPIAECQPNIPNENRRVTQPPETSDRTPRYQMARTKKRMRGAAIGRPRPRARRPREPPIPITEGDLVRAASLVEAEEVETRGLTPNEVCMATREITGHSISQLARMSATTLAALQRMTRAMRYIIELRDVSESIEEDTEIRYSEVVGVVLEVLDCLYEDANL